MQADRWKKVEELYHRALETGPDSRSAFLREACGDDEDLYREVDSLLGLESQAERFIRSPALEVAARVVAADNADPLVPDRIAHYKIIKLLGRGGMGEVYLAEDTKLGRKVALKFLPPHFTHDAGRLRRFEWEARAASALNHPNILTIYEIGEVEGQRFIATEFIDGQTLRERMLNRSLSIGEALLIAEEVASALASAHAEGIVHRDLKPENIMSRRDGIIKVLDFGLAKLTGPPAFDVDTDAETLAKVTTAAGTVMGTPSYMSPEQARGEKVDARTDIFSLGVILYEMVAGRVPFPGRNAHEVISEILKTEPAPLRSQAPEATAELERIATKALRKDREERYQLMRELLIDLKSQKQQLEFDAKLKAVTPLAGTDGGQAESTNPRDAQRSIGKNKPYQQGAIFTLALAAIAVAGVGFWLYKSFSQNKSTAAFQNMKITRLTTTGKATAAAISPDGKYVVHAMEDAGRQSLWLRQVATASDKQIVPREPVIIKGPTFSHDGNLVYYTASERGDTFTNGVLYQVPALGGTPRKLLTRVASPITLSPDGRRFAFVRDDEGLDGGTALIVANVDGTGEHVLVRHRDDSYFYLSGPAWSPDGHTIACGAGIGRDHTLETVVAVSVEDGTEKSITQGWSGPAERVAWVGDGSGLIVIAQPDVVTDSQIYHVSYPSGETRKITNDLSGYGTHSLTLAADSTTLVAVQEETTSKIWVTAPSENASRARPIANASGKFSGSWTPDGRIVYASKTGDNTDLWIMDQDGTNQNQLTADLFWEAYPMFSRDGRYIVFNSNRASVPSHSHIWRLNADGSDPKQLTSGNEEDYRPRFTPDGFWVVFFSWRSGKATTWKVSSNGGEPVQLIGQTSTWPAVSQDGKLIACSYHDEKAGTPWQLAVFSIEGGQPLKLFDVPPSVNFGTGLWWTPDGSAVVYADTLDGVSNIWRRPIDGGKPAQLTNFKSDLIFKFALSPDGKRLALQRGTVTNDVVLIRDLR